MEETKLEQFNTIHFIGIGGIGISAIARMMLLLGKTVSGSDISESTVTKKLQEEGVVVSIGHEASNVPEGADLVVYSIAIPELDPNNPELKKAQERGIKTLTYPEALGLLTQEKKTIAVAGTHGKTTTTAMIADILIEGNLDPTVIVGSLLSRERGNYIPGKGQYLVVEACEYRDSFLNLRPFIGVITNIDADHLDYFGNLENVQKSFKKFVSKIPKEGFLIAPTNDENVKPVLSSAQCKVMDYSQIGLNIPLTVIGEHNKKNAHAAKAVARELGITEEIIHKALGSFVGTWRRQEKKGITKKGALVYDDYAHHPTEIKATIHAFKESFPDKKISVLFQPHLYSRTKALFDDFVDALKGADGIVVTDIYAAREPEDKSITSGMLVQKINETDERAIYIKTFDEIVEKINEWADGDDVVVTVGAGDIYKVGERLLEK